MGATGGAQGGQHIGGNLACIKSVAALCGNPAQHLRLTGGAEQLAKRRGLAADQIMVAGNPTQNRLILRQIKGHARRNRHPFVGIADCRGKGGGQTKPAPVLRQPAKRINRPGDGD